MTVRRLKSLKNRGGTAVRKSLVLAVLLALTSGSLAQAAPIENTATAFGAIAVGNNQATGGYSIAVGVNNQATQGFAVAVGSSAKATAWEALAIGEYVEATNQWATVRGRHSKATGEQATAIGEEVEASGKYAFATGYKTKASGDYSIATGLKTVASGEHALAIGGKDSKATGNYSMTMGNWNSSSGKRAVTLGNSNYAFGKESVAIGNGTSARGDEALAIGKFADATGEDSVAIGKGAFAEGSFALALGGSRFNDSVAMGVNSTAIAGGNASETAQDGIAFGVASQATQENAVALGSYAIADRKSGIAGYDPGRGKATDDPGNAWKSTASALSIGGGVIDEEISATPKEGFGLSSTWEYFVEEVNGSNWEEERLNWAFEQEHPGQKYGRKIYATRQLTGLAAGSEDTDAVNVAQLKAARTYLKEGDHIHLDTAINEDKSTTYTVNVVTDGKVEKDDPNIVTGGTVWNETRPKQDGYYIAVANPAGENLTVLDRELHNTNERLNKVGAGAAALAALHPQDFNPEDKWDFAAGYGHYRNANAMAIGAFYRPDAKTMFSIGGSFGGGENLINAGVSFKFGKASPYAGVSKAALTTVIENQKTKINTLETQVAAQDARLSKQDAEIATLKAQNADIMRLLAELKK